MKALVFEDIIVDMAETEFEVHESMTWMECPAGGTYGWILKDGILVAPPEEVDPRTYAQLREAKYPKMGDQLDALYHAGVFPDEMAAKLKAIKDQFPKP